MAVESINREQPLARFTGKDPVDFRTKATKMVEQAKDYYTALNVPEQDVTRIISDQIKKARIARQRLKNPDVLPYTIHQDSDKPGIVPTKRYIRTQALNTLVEFNSLMQRVESFAAQKTGLIQSGDMQLGVPVTLNEK